MQPSQQKQLLVAGVAVGSIAALAYFLKKKGTVKFEKIDVETATLAQVVSLLEDMIKNQEELKLVVEKITEEFLKAGKPVTFATAMKRIKESAPKDPLEARGISLSELDRMLEKYQTAPQVRDAVAKMMASEPTGTTSEMTHDQIIEVHVRMAQELREIVAEVRKSNIAKMEPKMVTVAAQLLVSVQVQKELKFTPQDVEVAVAQNHRQLAASEKFANVNREIQDLLARLMEA